MDIRKRQCLIFQKTNSRKDNLPGHLRKYHTECIASGMSPEKPKNPRLVHQNQWLFNTPLQ